MSVRFNSSGNPAGTDKAQRLATLHMDRLNTFNLSRKHATTFDFSKVVPIDWLKTVPRDVIDLNTHVSLLGNATQAPVMSDIRQIVETFKVPYQAIYGNAWEQIIGVVKDRGGSAPDDARSFFNPASLFSQLQMAFVTYMDGQDSESWVAFLKSVCVLRSIYSSASILPYFNIHLQNTISGVDKVVTEFFNNLFDALDNTEYFFRVNNGDNIVDFYINSVPQDVSPDFMPDSIDKRFITSVSQLIEFIENFPSFYVYNNGSLVTGSIQGILSYDLQAIVDLSYRGYNKNVNIENLIAYQLVLADKFSNNLVDNIYTAEKFINSLYLIPTGSASIDNEYFPVDGQSYRYSSVSAHCISKAARFADGPLSAINSCNYLLNIFTFGRPLRYADYFTGSKLIPLAQGDVNVTVEDGEVSAIEMNKKEWLYSFLYNLHISSSEFKDYVRGIFGSNIEPSRSDIIRLVRTQRYLGKESIENTGEAQFNLASTSGRLPITNVLRGSSLPAKLLYHSKESCLLVTVCWHDVEIYRSNTVDRQSTVQTVLDEYIPELEFLGDQQVNTRELNASSEVSDTFSWNQRYAEYKMRYSFVSGGMLSDVGNGMLVTDSGYIFNGSFPVLSSDFIRQSIQDYERFFPNSIVKTLPVHAYVRVTSNMSAKRPMYINPQPMR